jgi:hypothetical protein
LLSKGNEFAQNTGDTRIRRETVEHGRSTLLAVARLLIVADMVDARKIEEAAEYVRFKLQFNLTISEYIDVIDSRNVGAYQSVQKHRTTREYNTC